MSDRRIIVIGAGGRLGAALVREWTAAGEHVLGFDRKQLNLLDESALRGMLTALPFDVVVNCAALTAVDYCESHSDEAMQVNAHAVRALGEICTEKGARCIHISTDYVFDGEKWEPYTEDDPPNPVSVYGQSKHLGEIALLETGDQHLVIRVSWVFGPDRPSFIDQIIQRATEQDHIEAIADKWAVPTYTLDAAQLLRPLLFDHPVGGILHVCNTGGCTWQEYGQYALDCAVSVGHKLKARTVGPLKMADLAAFVAKRPPYTVMSTAKLADILGHQPRPWQAAVEDYVRTMPSNKS